MIEGRDKKISDRASGPATDMRTVTRLAVTFAALCYEAYPSIRRKKLI